MMRKLLCLLVGALILVALNYTIYSREQLLTHGETVLLKLAPVDPRALMKGDYMVLRYAVANNVDEAIRERPVKDGYIVLQRDSSGVGVFSRLYSGETLASHEIKMRYRQRGNSIRFATNAYFFQEGKAALYEAAKYGEFKVAENGESILVAMKDAQLKVIGETLGH